MSRLYLYALLTGEEDLLEAGPGVAGEPVGIVRAGGLAAAAGEVEGPPAVDLASLRAHDAVVRRLAGGARALLPLRFGQLVDGRAALGEHIERHLPRLRAALSEVEDCEQTTWRVFGPREPTEPPRAGGSGPGARHLSELRARLRPSPPPAIAGVLSEVAPFVRAQRIERHGTGSLLATVYQLVPRADRETYAQRLADALEDLSGARVKVSGPWPPYAFAGRWPA